MQFRILLSYITPAPRAIVLSSCLTLTLSAIALINPLIAGQLTQTLLAESGTSIYPLSYIALFWMLLLVVRTLLNFVHEYYVGWLGEVLATRFRQRVYEHMQSLPMSYHQTHRRGDVLSVMTNDADTVSGFVTYTILPLLPMTVTLLGAFLMMLHLDWIIALLVLVCLPLYGGIVRLVGRQIRPLSGAWVAQYGALVARLEENLRVIAATKSFGRERFESQRFAAENASLLGIWRRQLRVESLLPSAIDLLAGLGLLLLLWLASWQIEQGLLSPANLVSLLLYAGLLLTPLRAYAETYAELQNTRGCAERLQAFFAAHPEPNNGSDESLQRVCGKIDFEQVTFAYPNALPVLRGLNLSIRAGETVAITGRNGAGKSTIAHLLMRFIEPAAGSVRIDGHDIAQMDLVSVRAQIGLVAQQVQLLNGSVADNIGYGCAGASMTAIAEAARGAHAKDFIEQLPDSYQTVIGDDGVRLSGGQRQRLALARALLKAPPILVLDEATAMFDPDSEAGFITECHSLLQNCTVILISHRPASLALADRVLVLEDGVIQ